MADLIDSLEQQHKEIIEKLEEIKVQTLSSNEKMQKLYEAKNTFLRHLSLEDAKLYPVLTKASERNSSLKRTLEIFAGEMKEITDKVVCFFDNLENLKLDKIDFAKEYGKFYALLKQRIRREENILYEEYKKVYAHI